ncbi:MAG: hypothetical protein QNL04_08920 [SAR324 cluster bacterium]|nr:hypothetical protein [SAR324 cluster bacterium]
MKKLTLLLFALFGFVFPNLALSQEKYSVQVGMFTNVVAYNLPAFNSDLSTKKAYGFQVQVLQDTPNLFNYGVAHYRVQSTANESLFFMDGFDAVADMYFGNRENLSKKLPFWEKLWVRVGGKFGMYRAFVSTDDGAHMSERKEEGYYQGEGYSYALYSTFGLGNIGGFEYSWRQHVSGSFNNDPINSSYFAYVQNWYF